ncbi:acetyltransferase (GNAT) family protein [Roseimicrobium gellanilyticum]|uniref:Acetyltransferase (GNAT) family protein n=1 Tax=Roseimicrobium gellanilyticum TaxID=748857 RepID=A0A366HR85_9BACT|nr:GNAT family N-acetyltransferase [Roseimicrobium gellanilyticum]RBP46185.1 acetyltransferase (GNAT) family protein [Roseimicrobium gellanilyticum]
MELPQGCKFIEGHESMDYPLVHAWLSSSYWTPGIERERIERAAKNSALVLGVEDAEGTQVAFLRIVSDKTRFAYVCDVWVADSHRGLGLARTMVRHAMEHPEFATVSTWTLGTKDAQGVYEPLGFRDVKEEGAYPYTWMVCRKN